MQYWCICWYRLYVSRNDITDLYICQVDEYQGGRSLEELQGYMDTQLAVINVNADRTDEKIPEKVQVEEEKPQENLVLSYWLIIWFYLILNIVMWSKMHEIWKLSHVTVYSFTKQGGCQLFNLIHLIRFSHMSNYSFCLICILNTVCLTMIYREPSLSWRLTPSQLASVKDSLLSSSMHPGKFFRIFAVSKFTFL